MNDTGGDTKVDLGDSRLPLPDLSGRAIQHYSIKRNTNDKVILFYWFF